MCRMRYRHCTVRMYRNVYNVFFSHSLVLPRCAGEQSHRYGSLPNLLQDIQLLATRIRNTSPLKEHTSNQSEGTLSVVLQPRLRYDDIQYTIRYNPTKAAMPLIPVCVLGHLRQCCKSMSGNALWQQDFCIELLKYCTSICKIFNWLY